MRATFKISVFWSIVFAFISFAFGMYLCFGRRSERIIPSGAKRCLAEMEYCQSLVRFYVHKNGVLPNSLTNIDVPPSKFICPVTGLSYIYVVVTNDGHPVFYMWDSRLHDGGYLIASNFAYPVRVDENRYVTITNRILAGTK